MPNIISIFLFFKFNNTTFLFLSSVFPVSNSAQKELPKIFENTSIVVMDGPFMCLDPYENEYHVLGNVKHAIHCWNEGTEAFWPHRYTKYINKGVIENPEPELTKIDKFIETGKIFFEDFHKLKHIGSMYTIRTVLTDRDHDDARPTLFNH